MRAEEVISNPVSAQENQSGDNNRAHTIGSTKSTTDNTWLIPFNGDKKSSSEFLRRLLLSHGVEVNLGPSEYLDELSFAEALKAASAVTVSVDELDLTVMLEMDTLFDMPKSEESLVYKASDQWEVIWLDFSNDGDFDEQRVSEQVKQTVEKKLSSPASQWQLDILLSRPATESELDALKRQGEYPKPQDPVLEAPTSAIGRQQSIKTAPAAASGGSVLRRWLSTLPLEVDLQDDCRVQEAIQNYLKNPSAQAPTIS